MVSDGSTAVVHGPTGVANEITSSAASYPLPDGLGSNRVWTNSSGIATGSAEWDAWGNLRSSSGSHGLHRWTGERQDPTSNLVYLRARDYSPGTGRFSQPDPIQPNDDGPQGYNPYWYANNNPTLLTDPTGLSAGQVNGSFSVTLSTSVAGALGIAFAGALVGAGAALLLFGGFSAFTFLVLAVLLFMLILYLQVAMNCVVHGCTLAEQSINGYLESQSRAGGTTWSFEVSGAKAGATACVLALAFSPLLVATPIAQGCGLPDKNCASALIDWVVDEAVDKTIDVTDPLVGPVMFAFAASSSNDAKCGKKQRCIVDPPSGNPQPPPGTGQTPPPGGDAQWEWKGRGEKGTPQGRWVNRFDPRINWNWDEGRATGERPHWDYRDGSNKNGYRYYPNSGRWEDKDICP